MASEELDRELDRFEVDRLVKQLAEKRKSLPTPPAPASAPGKVPPVPAPVPGKVPSAFVPFGSPTAVPGSPTSGASNAAPQSHQFGAPVAPAPRAASSSRRWSTNRLHMPSFATGQARKSFAFASGLHALHLPSLRAMSLPALPRIGFPILAEEQWAAITARMFVALGVVLSVMMPYWPYSNSHSWGLALYLFAVALVVITGVWGTKLTWDARLGRSHAIAIGTVIWGLTLASIAVLPHLGFGIG